MDIAVLRGCFDAGCTIPMWCIDNGHLAPAILSDDAQLLWDIMAHFHYCKDFKLQPRFFLSEKETTTFPSMWATIRQADFSLLSEDIDFRKNDVVIDLCIIPSKIIGCQTVIRRDCFIVSLASHTFAERPLRYYASLHPGVKLVVTNVPVLNGRSDYETPLEKSFFEKGVTVREVRQRIMEESKNGNRIFVETPLDAFGWSTDEFIRLTTSPAIELRDDGSTFFKQYDDPLFGLENGYRKTAWQPKQYANTIWCIGTCTYIGFGAPWDRTFESWLQKTICESGEKWRVVNASQYYAGRYQDAFYNILKLPVKSGDIVLICLQNLRADGFPFIDLQCVFKRPHELGEVFLDQDHLNENGYRHLARIVHDKLIENDYYCWWTHGNLTVSVPHSYGVPDHFRPDPNINAELEEQLNNLRRIKRETIGRTGCIVMNCNPFTLGHQHLIEYASARVVFLFILVVEEDSSVFPFKDRIELVRKGTSMIPNVTVISSGNFVLSKKTFSGYFNKEAIQDEVVDPSMDIDLFGSKIAPALGIDVRFAGAEPLDKVTEQYNRTMERILPIYGVDFEEVPRIESSGGVISASRVRKLLMEGDLDSIRSLVPSSTFNYLEKNADIIRTAIIAKKNTVRRDRFNGISKLAWNGDQQSLQELDKLAEEGETKALIQLGRMLKDGRYKSVDVSKAILCLRDAYSRGDEDAAQYLFDALWKEGTTQSFNNAFEVASLHEFDCNMQARLGRSYREGRGVDKDLHKAADWMRKAHEGGVKWADWELFDILWRINTPESMTEALGFGMPLAESGVKELQGWIARCYREGRGVEKDLDKATEWMRKAYDQKLGYASWELFDILWRIDTPESLKEAVAIAEPLAQSGNRELQGRMGRAYRDGKGVEKNLDAAREWFKKAADQDLAWAKKELAGLDNHQA